MKNSLKTLIAAAVLAGFAPTIQALPYVTGDVFIGAFGSHVVINKTANTVTFVDDNLVIPGNAHINNGTGSFSALLGANVNYANFTYSPLSVVNPLWSLVLGGGSFDLTSITSVDEGGLGLVLSGSGVIHLAGFEDTTGNWSFSADNTRPNFFNFSSTTTTAGVPDGGTTVMLLGGALTGLGLLRKKLFAA